MRKRPCHLALITVAICVSMAGVGGDRRLLSGGSGFLAISDILFSPSCHLGGATVVIFSIGWHNSLFGIYVQEVLIRKPGFLLYRRLFIGHRNNVYIGSSPYVENQGGCRYGLFKVTVSCGLEMRRVMVVPHLDVRSFCVLCVCAREGSLSPFLPFCLLVSVLGNR